MREKHIFENAHPDTLILKSLIFPYFVIIHLIVLIHRIRPILLDILHRFFKQFIPLFWITLFTLLSKILGGVLIIHHSLEVIILSKLRKVLAISLIKVSLREEIVLAIMCVVSFLYGLVVHEDGWDVSFDVRNPSQNHLRPWNIHNLNLI